MGASLLPSTCKDTTATTASSGCQYQTNGVVERFNRSLKYEHLYREEIHDVIDLRDEVEAYRELYNWVRPHETLGQLPPMTRYLGEQPADPTRSHLSEPETVQES